MTLALAIIVGASADDVARYYSTATINTDAGDTPASTHFRALISADDTVSFSRSISCIFWGGSSAASIGSIDLLNGDGELDVLITKTMRDRSVTILRGELGTDVSTWDTVGTAVLDRVQYPDETRCRLILLDKAALLDKPIQDVIYTTAANTTLNTSPKPMLVGAAFNVPLLLEDPANLDYDASDTGTPTFTNVKDNGDILNPLAFPSQYTTSGYTMTLGQQPVGVITADVVNTAQTDFDDFVVYFLRTKLGLSTGDVPTANLAALTAVGHEMGVWVYDGASYTQIMDSALTSYAGWWYFDRLGALQVGRLELPTGSIDHELTVIEVMQDQISVELDRAPGLNKKALGQRNWRVHSESEIAGSLTDPTYTQAAYDLQQNFTSRVFGAGTLHSTYAHGNGPSSPTGELGSIRPGKPTEFGIGTLITNSTDVSIQAEATRWVGLYTAPRHFCTFVATVEAAYTIEPGDIVNLTVDRYGFDSGKKMLVVSVDGDFMSDTVTIVGWF